MDHLGSKLTDENSIVYQCHKHGILIYCPALNDSSIGIGLTHHRHRARGEHRAGVIIDSIQDNYELTQIVVKSPGTAAIYVAGGIPKNFINDSVVMSYIFGLNRGVGGEFMRSRGDRRLIQPSTVLLPAVRRKFYR
jgi:deoxyhypusine synthase